jgi:hypothetical protein
MFLSAVQVVSSPAGVLAIVAGSLALAMGRSPAWPLFAGVRSTGAAVITVSIAAAVYAGVTTINAVFNT